jgi:lipid biosynthesis B12-binding/radical SAM protein
MVRIALISCNATVEPYPVYPIGMGMVASAARLRGHEVLEWDGLAQGYEEALSEAVERFEPDIIGLSIRNIDNVNSLNTQRYIEHYRGVMAILREMSSAPIVLGGAGYSLFPERLLSELGADYGVVGEGEKVFCDLIERFKSGFAPAESILTGTPLKKFSMPERDPFLAKYYQDEGGMLSVQTKRGCPHQCAYCTYPLLEGSCYRHRPADEVVDELLHLRDAYNAEYLSFTDSVFNDAQDRYLEIVEGMVRRELNVPWMAFFRPSGFDKETVDLLKRSKLHSVEWGTDCASDATLEAMGKQLNWRQVADSHKALTDAGVAGAHFIMFGGPGETAATLNEGLENIAGLDKAVVFGYLGVRILPGTHIETIAREQGVLADDSDLLDSHFYFSPEITRDDADAALRASFADRPDRIYPPEQDPVRVQAFHRMGHRGPIWDLILSQPPQRRRRRSK